MAASPSVREEFRRLRREVRAAGAALGVDRQLAFLSAASRLAPAVPVRRPPAEGRMLL